MTTTTRRGRRGRGNHRYRPDSTPHSKEPSIIRIAQREEEDGLLDICRELHEENGLFSFSEEKVRAILQRSFDKKLAMVGVIGPPGKIEACACLLITQFYYSEDWHIEELWNFVRAPYRKSQHARAMAEWAKGMADRLGVRLIMGVVSNIRLAAKLRLYRRVFGDDLSVAGKRFPEGLDVDAILQACGVAGAYFVYTPKTLYSGAQAAGNASPH